MAQCLPKSEACIQSPRVHTFQKALALVPHTHGLSTRRKSQADPCGLLA